MTTETTGAGELHERIVAEAAELLKSRTGGINLMDELEHHAEKLVRETFAANFDDRTQRIFKVIVGAEAYLVSADNCHDAIEKVASKFYKESAMDLSFRREKFCGGPTKIDNT